MTNALNGAILRTALMAGTLDGLAGMALYYSATDRNPIGVFPYIASGLLGKSASTGGPAMIVMGVVLHYFIAFCFTLFFFWLYARWSVLRQHKLAVAVLYGLFVWAVMNLIVVPLSAIGPRPFSLTNALLNAVILIVTIGFPVAYGAARKT